MKKIQYNGISKLLSGIVSKINNLIDIVEMKADWEQTDPTAFDYIKNKPDSLDEKVKQENTTTDADYRVLLSKSANDVTENDKAWKNSNLKYNPSTGNLQTTKLNGNIVPSGSGNDTLAKTSDIPDMSDYIEKSLTVGLVKNDGTIDQSDYVESSDLATVATSGSYNDLIDKPTIPAGQVQSDWEQNDDTEVDYIKNKPTLADVATSGSYNDLTDTPTIPTVNDGKLTINQNGTLKGEFTANDSDDVTVNLTDTTYTASGVVSIDANNNITSTAEVNQNTFAKVKVGSTTITADAKQDTLELVAGDNVTLTPDATNDKVTISTTAEVNQNAFSNVKVGDTTIEADTKTDTLELVAGTNVTLTADATNDKLTISATDTKYNTMAANEVYTGSVTTAKVARADRLKTDINNLIDDKINLLDDSGGTAQASETIASWSETDGKVTISTQAIAIQKSQVSDFSHTHGNIQNGGTLQTTDVAIANGDKLVITDASDSNKIARTSRSFDGSTTTKALTPKGTFETFSKLELGETSDNAYYGDKGKTAYDHSQLTSGNPHGVTKSDVGLGNVPNVTTNNQTPTFSQASTRANIASGEKMSVIMGKIMKWFDDLKDLAFIAKDGTSSTRYLRGDGTWQPFPTIPAAQVNSDWDATSGVAQILNKPTIPTVNNAKLTIQKNGTTVKTFTANAASDVTANIIVPTALSDLTEDTTHRVVTDTQISTWDSKGTSNLTLGTSSSTAYRGDRGNTAYTHASDSGRLTTATTTGLYKVGSTAQGHISELVAVEKADITALGIPGSDTNTHRPIQLNGTQILGNNTTVLNLKNGSNISMSNSGGTVTINATDTTYSAGYGISISGNQIDNNGVRGIATGEKFGCYLVNHGGTSAEMSINLTGEFQAAGQDLNDFKTSGFYYFNSTNVPTNVPVGTNGVLIVITSHINTSTGIFVKQIWMRHGTNNSNDYNTYIRTFNNSSWSNWHYVITSEGGVLTGMIGSRHNMGSVDYTQANNGIDSNAYMAMIEGQDKNGKRLSRLETIAYPDGKIALNLSVSNYTNNATPAQNRNALTCYFDKSQNVTYSVFSPANFRTALELKGNATWSKYNTYTGTGNKAMMVAESYNELFFCVHIDTTNIIDMTIPIPIAAITATSSSSPQQIRQGYNYATNAFGFVSINVWIQSSKVYCKLNQVFQNNTTNIASSTSYDVYYR